MFHKIMVDVTMESSTFNNPTVVNGVIVRKSGSKLNEKNPACGIIQKPILVKGVLSMKKTRVLCGSDGSKTLEAYVEGEVEPEFFRPRKIGAKPSRWDWISYKGLSEKLESMEDDMETRVMVVHQSQPFRFPTRRKS